MFPGKDNGQGKGSLQPCQCGPGCRHWIKPFVQIPGQQMGYYFRIGVGEKLVTQPFQFRAQRLEVLDDAVMDNGRFVCGVGMGVDFVGPSVGSPAGMAYSDSTTDGVLR